MDVDTIEQMFEYSSMSPALTLENHEPRRADIHALRQKIHSMERVSVQQPVFPITEALRPVFPQGGLVRGAIYQLDSSSSLMWSLLAEATSEGTWCALVGVPDAGVAAAEELGVNTDRLVLIPSPGSQWMAVLGALIDVVGICVLGSFPAPSERVLSTVQGRLRERGATVLVRSSWPRIEASISAHHSWRGVDSGRGVLREHYLTVSTTQRSGVSSRSCDLVIDASGLKRAASHVPVIHLADHRKAG